jgi:hypothetical protein
MSKKKSVSVENIILDEIKELRTDVKEVVKKVERLEVKASLWGGIMGVFGGILTILIPGR